MKNRTNTRWLTQLALLVAVLLVMNYTPLGYLQVGPLSMSLLTIPVAIGAMTLGPVAGATMAKVFIVEDNPTIIQMIQDELTKWKHTVVTVKDWDHVADEIEKAAPDLILFDITLPTFDGFYWINAVRQITKVPIIEIGRASCRERV